MNNIKENSQSDSKNSNKNQEPLQIQLRYSAKNEKQVIDEEFNSVNDIQIKKEKDGEENQEEISRTMKKEETDEEVSEGEFSSTITKSFDMDDKEENKHFITNTRKIITEQSKHLIEYQKKAIDKEELFLENLQSGLNTMRNELKEKDLELSKLLSQVITQKIDMKGPTSQIIALEVKLDYALQCNDELIHANRDLKGNNEEQCFTIKQLALENENDCNLRLKRNNEKIEKLNTKLKQEKQKSNLKIKQLQNLKRSDGSKQLCQLCIAKNIKSKTKNKKVSSNSSIIAPQSRDLCDGLLKIFNENQKQLKEEINQLKNKLQTKEENLQKYVQKQDILLFFCNANQGTYKQLLTRIKNFLLADSNDMRSLWPKDDEENISQQQEDNENEESQLMEIKNDIKQILKHLTNPNQEDYSSPNRLSQIKGGQSLQQQIPIGVNFNNYNFATGFNSVGGSIPEQKQFQGKEPKRKSRFKQNENKLQMELINYNGLSGKMIQSAKQTPKGLNFLNLATNNNNNLFWKIQNQQILVLKNAKQEKYQSSQESFTPLQSNEKIPKFLSKVNSIHDQLK